ncbi:hypothetical protein V2J09_012866 [Rumex salicifolius]
MGKEAMLLDFWPSMFGIRIRIALAEKGVDYDAHEEDLLHSPNKSHLLLEMNPVHKKIPVLIHKGRPVCESLVILEYIDEVWSDRAPLMPSDPYRRAQARFWADYIENKVIYAGVKIAKTKKEEQEKAKTEFLDILKVLEEQALGESPFFGGDEFGFVDVVLIAFYCWFYAFEVEGGFKVDDMCPKMVAWASRCMDRESVAKSLPGPERIHQYVLELMKKYGSY